jgi:hypothetical protein
MCQELNQEVLGPFSRDLNGFEGILWNSGHYEDRLAVWSSGRIQKK